MKPIVVMHRRTDDARILLDYNTYRVWMIPELVPGPDTPYYLEAVTRVLRSIGYEEIGTLEYDGEGTVSVNAPDDVTVYNRHKLDEVLNEYRKVLEK